MEPEGQSLRDPEGKITLTCHDTLTNNEDIQKKGFQAGDEFMVGCMENCVKEMNDLNIYGSLEYSDDSSICLSAFHGGSLDPDGGDFMVKVDKPVATYESENRNGVMSKSKEGDPAGKSMSFEKLEDSSK